MCFPYAWAKLRPCASIASNSAARNSETPGLGPNSHQHQHSLRRRRVLFQKIAPARCSCLPRDWVPLLVPASLLLPPCALPLRFAHSTVARIGLHERRLARPSLLTQDARRGWLVARACPRRLHPRSCAHHSGPDYARLDRAACSDHGVFDVNWTSGSHSPCSLCSAGTPSEAPPCVSERFQQRSPATMGTMLGPCALPQLEDLP